VEYRVDDLARAAGTTVRNVRAYAERGLLPPPQRLGRTNIYGEAHRARLRLIGSLLDRGYTFAHIAEFLTSWRQGHDIGQTLGLEAALLGPAGAVGGEELPRLFSRAELQETFGEVSDGALARAVRLGLIAPDGDRFRVEHPRLLLAGAELAGIGVGLGEILDVAEQLQAHIGAVAALFVRVAGGHLVSRFRPGELPADSEIPALVEVVERLRPLARTAVDTELAVALDEEIRSFVAGWLTQAQRTDRSG
jgi:DNA-binding transcriptional MerR regulator